MLIYINFLNLLSRLLYRNNGGENLLWSVAHSASTLCKSSPWPLEQGSWVFPNCNHEIWYSKWKNAVAGLVNLGGFLYKNLSYVPETVLFQWPHFWSHMQWPLQELIQLKKKKIKTMKIAKNAAVMPLKFLVHLVFP